MKDYTSTWKAVINPMSSLLDIFDPVLEKLTQIGKNRYVAQILDMFDPVLEKMT